MNIYDGQLFTYMATIGFPLNIAVAVWLATNKSVIEQIIGQKSYQLYGANIIKLKYQSLSHNTMQNYGLNQLSIQTLRTKRVYW